MAEPTPEPPHDAPPAPAADAAHAADRRAPADAAPPAHRAPLLRGLLVAVALAFGAWGAWTAFAPGAAERPGGDARARIEALEQQVAILRRSDQISREANRDLQGTLAERDEEIAGLRADVAFYERFVGATGARRGLTVHQLQLQPQSAQAWHFTATLTQNLNRGAVSTGRVTLSVEGTRAGKLQKLSWGDLRQQADAPGVAYSFKYFQEVAGDLVLPPGFQPLRVTVRLQPQGAASVEQSFAWADATRRSGPGA